MTRPTVITPSNAFEAVPYIGNVEIWDRAACEAHCEAKGYHGYTVAEGDKTFATFWDYSGRDIAPVFTVQMNVPVCSNCEQAIDANVCSECERVFVDTSLTDVCGDPLWDGRS